MPNVFNASTFKDDQAINLGDSTDFKLKYDTGDSRLEILDAADNVLGHIVDNGATATLTWLGGMALSTGAISSGTWTPTVSAGVNVASSTASTGQYIRVGNAVSFSVAVSITPTAGAPTNTTFELSLPIASNFSGSGNLASSGTFLNGTTIGNVRCISSAANDTMDVRFYAISTSAHFLTLTGVYTII